MTTDEKEWQREQEVLLEQMGYERASLAAWESPGCDGGYIHVLFKHLGVVIVKALDGDNCLRAWRTGDDVRVALEELRDALLCEANAYQTLAGMTDVARRPNKTSREQNP